MTPRERVLAALSRKVPDKVPRYMRFCPELLKKLKEKTGASDPAKYFNFEVRDIPFSPIKAQNDFSRYLGDLPKGTEVDEWGVGWIPGSVYHFTKMVHPLRNLESVSDLKKYPWPDIMEPYRYEGLKELVKSFHDRGLAVRGYYPGIQGSLFETSWRLRGMEELLTDFYFNKPFATYLLDKVTEIHCYALARQAEADVDIIRLADDVGTQRGMLISPQVWRYWLKERTAKVIRSAKKVKPDILIFFHSDGYIEDIIPDLIDIGVEILNPVQPECMDPAKLKRLYGNSLSFWGTIGTQTTMPFGTPQEVKETVKLRIKTVGEGGGLLLEPTHILEPEVPWENIMAFIEAVEEYGWYN